MTWDEYAANVEGILAKTEPHDLLTHFTGHGPRFQHHFNLWKKIEPDLVALGRPGVADMGTPFPFSTMYWATEHGMAVTYCNLQIHTVVGGRVFFEKVNLNRPLPFMGRFGLVVCTEVLEHLSANLYQVRNRLQAMVIPGGYLLLSFPCGGINARDYWRSTPEKFDERCDQHEREWTHETALDFARASGWDLVDWTATEQPLYGAPIDHALLRRPME
jgi:SAM-dependent methyltransferase